MRSPWEAVKCAGCDEVLYGVRESPGLTRWVHFDGWDPETLEVNQVEKDHMPEPIFVPVEMHA